MPTSVLAQTVEWQRQFSVGTLSSGAAGVVAYSDSILYSVCTVRIWGYNPPTGPSARGIGLVKLKSSTGDTLFVKRINAWTGGFSSSKLHRSFEGSLVIALTSAGDTIYDSQILIQKVDTNGSSIWICPVTSGYANPQISKVMPTNDGGTFVLGSALSTIGGFQDWFLMKISYNGQLMWSQRYNGGTNWYCEGNNIEPLRNGNYLVSGMAERRVWAVEVDGEGNEVAQTVMYETSQPYLIFGAQTAQGYPKSFYSFGVVQSNPRRFYFSKKDSLYQTVWGGEQIEMIGQFYANTSGGNSILISGRSSADSMYINVISADSAVIWRKALPKTGIFSENAIINDITFDGLGNAILCGTSNKPANTLDELFFMKISGIGLPYDPFADTILVGNRAHQRENSLKIYPNPGHNQVWISGFEGKMGLRFFSSDGRLIFQAWVEEGIPITLSHLPKGMYSYLAQQGNKQWSGKWIKE